MIKQCFKKKTRHVARRVRICVLGTFAVCMMCGCTKREQMPEDVLILGGDPDTAVISQYGEKETGGTDNVEKDVPQAGLPADDAGTGKREIYVHICGAVNSPGVFVLPEGSRVFDAVKAADGFTEDASPDHINQAQTITDGCKIRIPTVEEVQALVQVEKDADATEFLIQEDTVDASKPTGEDAGGKVNINEADTVGLCTLNGIGEGRAAAIIKYRETHGRFGSIEEIMQVAGIKQGVFEKIKDQISVK